MRYLAALCLVLAAFMGSPADAQYSRVISFGDSFGVRSKTNGPTTFQRLATELNVQVVNSSVSGGKASQLLTRVREHIKRGVDRNALYVLWNNGNEFFCLASGCNPSTVADSSARKMRNAVNELRAKGVRYIWVLQPTDLSLRPAANGAEDAALAVWQIYDQAMRRHVAVLPVRYAEVSPMYRAMTFRHTDIGCQQLTPDCTDPWNYLWWDHLHPSAEANERLARALLL